LSLLASDDLVPPIRRKRLYQAIKNNKLQADCSKPDLPFPILPLLNRMMSHFDRLWPRCVCSVCFWSGANAASCMCSLLFAGVRALCHSLLVHKPSLWVARGCVKRPSCTFRFVLDETDGRVARMLNQTSTLGIVLDMVTDRHALKAQMLSLLRSVCRCDWDALLGLVLLGCTFKTGQDCLFPMVALGACAFAGSRLPDC
jgi:CDP-alcohol phosphatidyltransferase